MKNSLAPAGIEPATFRFVAQYLNYCATSVLTYIHIHIYIYVYMYINNIYIYILICHHERLIALILGLTKSYWSQTRLFKTFIKKQKQGLSHRWCFSQLLNLLLPVFTQWKWGIVKVEQEYGERVVTECERDFSLSHRLTEIFIKNAILTESKGKTYAVYRLIYFGTHKNL